MGLERGSRRGKAIAAVEAKAGGARILGLQFYFWPGRCWFLPSGRSYRRSLIVFRRLILVGAPKYDEQPEAELNDVLKEKIWLNTTLNHLTKTT